MSLTASPGVKGIPDAASETSLGVPVRAFSDMHLGHAGLWGFDGLANQVSGMPAHGTSVTDVKRALLGTAGVASVQSLDETFANTSDSLERTSGIIALTAIFVLMLSLLIAVNTANINAEERMRDHATMFAYGVRYSGTDD